MRIALVSPYSWTYPGGVTRHIEALAEQYLAAGHDVRVLAPFDPHDRLAARLHRGARPAGPRRCPTTSCRSGARSASRANGAVSNARARRPAPSRRCAASSSAAASTSCTSTSRSRPVVGWDALMSGGAPLVGTFHCYSENASPTASRNADRRAPAR